MDKLLIHLPETIETSKLILQMPKAGFGEQLHEAILDGYEDYVQWLNWPSNPPSIELIEKDCRQHHADFILRNCIRYLILDKTNQIVGRCAFPPHQSIWEIPQFGISYFIRKSQRSKGYATEAVRLMALLAFNVLNAKKVAIYCDSENISSTKIPQKLGFKHECTQKGEWPRRDGKLTELRTYAIFSKDDLSV